MVTRIKLMREDVCALPVELARLMLSILAKEARYTTPHLLSQHARRA